MLQRTNRPFAALLAVAAISMLVLAGCATSATGGGWIVAVDGEGKANFGFTVDSEKDQFRGTYHDRSADVRIRFTGIDTASGSSSCLEASAEYEAQGRDSGSGIADVVVCDPEGAATLSITIVSGPHAGYSNSGEVQGNITTR